MDARLFSKNRSSRRLIEVVADDRERHSGVIETLQAIDGLTVTEKRLPLGDFLVDKRVLIERKTLQDLGASIVDDRLFAQAIRMKESCYRPMFIIEGTSLKQSAGPTRQAIQGAMVTLTLILGIPCLRSFDPEDTANLIRFAAGQVSKVEAKEVYRHGYRPKRRRRRQLFILQGLPGIGPDKAERLLSKFGSIRSALNADAEQLTGIPGIGPKLAAGIRDIAGPDPSQRIPKKNHINSTIKPSSTRR